MISISEAVRPHLDAILDRWAEEVQKSVSAFGLTRVECEGEMRAHLVALLRHSEEDDTAAEHVRTRLRQGFELTDIVDDFASLGRTVSRHWSEHADLDRPDPTEVEHFYSDLHASAKRAVEVFEDHMFDDEQREKRYERRLDLAVTRKLHDHAGDDDYGVPLAVIAEAVGASSAVFVLRRGSDELLESAWGEPVATAALSLHLHGTALDVRDPAVAFDSTIASGDAALRSAGVRTVLGTRLSSPDGHRISMVLGRDGRASFTPRDVRRTECLAERFAWHLERARLHSDLSRTVAALRREKLLREHFVAVVAHDLRGPLSAAKTGAALLACGPSSTLPPVDVLRRMDRALSRAERMLRDLMDATGIHAGRPLTVKREALDLVALTRSVVDDITPLHDGACFVVHGDGRVDGHWSRSEVYRSVWNMLENAVKYGTHGAPIDIDVRAGEGVATIAIHNDGAPIAPERHHALFDPFTRVVDSGAEIAIPTGWGLGLTLVRGCAESHGGAVRVESTRELGTTFTLELPLDDEPLDAQSEIEPASTVRSVALRA